jgi:hypothetical protein
MAELQKYRLAGTVQPNVTPLSGTITIGAAGAITAQTDTRNSGVTFVKNGAGRYDGTLHRSYRRFMGADQPVMINPTAGTAKSLTTGVEAELQGISAAQVAGTSGISTFSIVTFRQDTGALADPASGMIISWAIDLSDSP